MLQPAASSDEPTETRHPNLHLYSFTVSFSSLFSCPGRNFTVLIHSRRFYRVAEKALRIH